MPVKRLTTALLTTTALAAAAAPAAQAEASRIPETGRQSQCTIRTKVPCTKTCWPYYRHTVCPPARTQYPTAITTSSADPRWLLYR